MAASDYIDAAEKYVAGYCENRPVVQNGKRTGETQARLRRTASSPGRPGDVTVAEKKGGLVSIVSTREYSSQMPNTIIGIDKWMKDNRPIVEGHAAGHLRGRRPGEVQHRGLPQRRPRSAPRSTTSRARTPRTGRSTSGVVNERDKQGLTVELGGSSVNNLADNLLLFGLAPGSSNLFAATYKVFGDIVVAPVPRPGAQLLPGRGDPGHLATSRRWPGAPAARA